MAVLSAQELALGQTLLQLGRITRSQLDFAQRRHEVCEGSFAGHLVRLGLVSDRHMGAVVAQSRGLLYQPTQPSGQPVADVLTLCRREICLALSFLPLAVEGGQLTVWLGEGNPEKVADWARRRIGLRLVLFAGPVFGRLPGD